MALTLPYPPIPLCRQTSGAGCITLSVTVIASPSALPMSYLKSLLLYPYHGSAFTLSAFARRLHPRDELRARAAERAPRCAEVQQAAPAGILRVAPVPLRPRTSLGDGPDSPR